MKAALTRAGGGCAAQALAGLLSADSERASPADRMPRTSEITPPSAEPLPLARTLREVLFDPAQYLKADVAVSGTLAYLDLGMHRMDLADDGARLIIDISHLDKSSVARLGLSGAEPGVLGSRITGVVGRVKKQQRRTFLEAHALRG